MLEVVTGMTLGVLFGFFIIGDLILGYYLHFGEPFVNWKKLFSLWRKK